MDRSSHSSLRPRFDRARALTIGLIAFSILTLTVGCRTFDPVNPEPVPAASSRDRTESAIRDALRREGWRVTERSEKRIIASSVLEEFPVVLRVDFDEESVELRWLSSRTPGGSTDEEKAALRRLVRRSLGDLQERIAYLIESIDLIPDGDPAPSRAKRD